MNKMVARVLFYAQESPSNGNSKGTKLKEDQSYCVSSLGVVYGDWVFSHMAKNGTILPGTTVMGVKC